MRRPALALLLLALTACAPLKVHRHQADLMHTRWDLDLAGTSAAQALRDSEGAAALIDALDQRLAMWKPSSELAGVNRSAGSGQAVTLSAEVAACLRSGLAMHALSQGALDPTVGALSQGWWQARQEGRLPSGRELKAWRGLTGVHQLRLEDGAPATLQLLKAGLKLDLGAVAKGYAQDQAAAWLRSRGYRSLLLNAGGQVYALGRKPDGTRWRAAIQHPRDGGRVVSVVELEDACLSTSGDYEQVSMVQGRRVHHIFDPRSGRSTEGMASASVLLPLAAKPGRAGAWSDLLSTAAFVLGPAKGLALIASQGGEGLLISEDAAGRLTAHASPGWPGPVALEP